MTDAELEDDCRRRWGLPPRGATTSVRAAALDELLLLAARGGGLLTAMAVRSGRAEMVAEADDYERGLRRIVVDLARR